MASQQPSDVPPLPHKATQAEPGEVEHPSWEGQGDRGTQQGHEQKDGDTCYLYARWSDGISTKTKFAFALSLSIPPPLNTCPSSLLKVHCNKCDFSHQQNTKSTRQSKYRCQKWAAFFAGPRICWIQAVITISTSC